MSKNYYIGLDMGTESVGWAVTDRDYNLVKQRGNDFWGVYLFDEAHTAEERRAFRAGRRRIARTRHRLMLLQELFDREISAKDFGFFRRLENSRYLSENKAEEARGKYLLFNDEDFNDKDFYKKYPTVFHLRSSLISEEIKDVRLLYLAIHHIIKNRGHFLFEGQNFEVGDTQRATEEFRNINLFLGEYGKATFPEENWDEIFGFLCDNDMARSGRKEKILALTRSPKDKILANAVSAMVGLEFSLKKLFDAGEDDFAGADKLSFEDAGFDEKFANIRDALGDDRAAFVESLKKIHSLAKLNNILNGKKFISQAKTETYEAHRSDLAALKKYVRENCPEKYNLVFRRQKTKDKKADTEDGQEQSEKKKAVCNYAAYIGMDKGKGFAKCNKRDFYDFLKKEVKVKDEKILAKIEAGTFLPKSVSSENCEIPYQVHLEELKAILKNAENYFPFLNQRDESCGLTVSQKIVSLMTFRVPYYVGPFTDKETRFSWMIKKEGFEKEKITPWNFDSVVDKDKSEERFIQRMTNFCSYLTGEKVLPAASFLYSEFVLLNELNNLKVNGEKNPRAKEILYELAKREKKLTLKKCRDELVKEGVLPKDSKAQEVFSGTDGDFKSSLSSYIDFKRIIGDKADEYPDMCEQIILWITIISDKKRLEKLIREKYSEFLGEDEIKQIKSLNYTKWGRLSAKLLSGIYETDSDGEVGDKSIIERLREGTDNFMQLLSDGYGYKRSIDLANDDSSVDDRVTYRAVDELYCSPAVKRSIWSAVKIVREIIKVQGKAPAKVFVEMTREVKDGSKKGARTVSRKQELLKLYKENCKKEKELIKQLESADDIKFNSDKMFFYFTQMGRDIYTGEKIGFDDVFNTRLYDIDHIYPRSKIKDDSLNNRVLVSKKVNQSEKRDVYPLPGEMRSKMVDFWLELKEKKLISEEKYYRLMRSAPLTVSECEGFVNAQLVATSQSTKAAAQLLRRMLPGTEVVYSKAGNVNEFKDRLKFVKVRELNDLHHAKDAYFNIVVGNVFSTKFNHSAAVFFKNNGEESYNFEKIYNFDVKGAWKAGDENRIRSIAEKNTCSVVRFAKEEKGQLFNATIYPAGKNDKLIPVKGVGPLTDTSKYGGHNSAKTAYFMLVKSKGKKGETLLSLECVSVLADKKIRTIEDKLKYCETVLKLKEPEICIEKIKLNTLFRINGSYAWLRGKDNDRRNIFCNANQLWLDNDSTKYLKKITNYFKDVKKCNNKDLPVDEEKINARQNLALYDLLTEKLGSKTYAGLPCGGQANKLKSGRDKFEGLSLKDQCYVLMKVLEIMDCKNMGSDIRLVGGAANDGRNLINKFFQNSDVKIIFSSPTGYFRSVVDLKSFL